MIGVPAHLPQPLWEVGVIEYEGELVVGIRPGDVWEEIGQTDVPGFFLGAAFAREMADALLRAAGQIEPETLEDYDRLRDTEDG